MSLGSSAGVGEGHDYRCEEEAEELEKCSILAFKCHLSQGSIVLMWLKIGQ
jgi:hypothetical protein